MIKLDIVDQLVLHTLDHDPRNQDKEPEELHYYFNELIREGHFYGVIIDGEVKSWAQCFWLDDEIEIQALQQGIWPPEQYVGKIFYVHNAVNPSGNPINFRKLWKLRPKGQYKLRFNRLTGRRPNHVADYSRI